MVHVLVMMNMNEEDRKKLEAVEGYVFRYTDSKTMDEELLAGAEMVIGNPTMEQIALCPKLKWIQTPSAGTDAYRNLSPEIKLSNAYGIYGPYIAEYMLSGVLLCAKDWPLYQSQQRQREWKAGGSLRYLKDMNVMSIGMGSIGSSFLQKMNLLGSTCYGVRRTSKEVPSYVEDVYLNDTFESHLKDMDVIALSLPKTSDTIHILNESRLRMCKKDAILINVGRGSAIDTDALIRVCKDGYFQGVILDVLDPEPLPLNNPLWTMENVHITPHISGRYYAQGIEADVNALIRENLKRVNEGNEPIHLVDPTIGY